MGRKPKTVEPIKVGSRAKTFDAIQDLGGEIEDIGRAIRKHAVLFPATRGWIVDDLVRLVAVAQKARNVMAK